MAGPFTCRRKKEIFYKLKSTASKLYPGLNPRSIAYYLSAIALSLFQLGRIDQWLRRNAKNKALKDELHNSSRMYGAMLRPYVNKKWTIADRLDALEQHYLALQAKGPLLVFDEEHYLNLVELGPQYLDLRVVVDKPGWLRGEGEIGVSLFCQNCRIYTAMFLVTGNSDSRRMVVGGIQGWGMPQAKDLYVDLTHALHRLRPRDLLVSILKMIATNLGCSEIHGVSDECHRSTQMFTSATKKTTYDDIWQEHGGTLNSDGFFVMPAQLLRREAADIPSRKRAQYRRRYKLLNNIQQRIDHAFSTNERLLRSHGQSSPNVEAEATV